MDRVRVLMVVIRPIDDRPLLGGNCVGGHGSRRGRNRLSEVLHFRLGSFDPEGMLGVRLPLRAAIAEQAAELLGQARGRLGGVVGIPARPLLSVGSADIAGGKGKADHRQADTGGERGTDAARTVVFADGANVYLHGRLLEALFVPDPAMPAWWPCDATGVSFFRSCCDATGLRCASAANVELTWTCRSVPAAPSSDRFAYLAAPRIDCKCIDCLSAVITPALESATFKCTSETKGLVKFPPQRRLTTTPDSSRITAWEPANCYRDSGIVSGDLATTSIRSIGKSSKVSVKGSPMSSDRIWRNSSALSTSETSLLRGAIP